MNNNLNQLIGTLPYIRSSQKQSEHDRLIQLYISRYYGFRMQVDHLEDWKHFRPDIINGHRPDIIIFDNLGETIIEVETLDSCMSSHSIDQVKAFSKKGLRTKVVIPSAPLGMDFRLRQLREQYRFISNVEIIVI